MSIILRYAALRANSRKSRHAVEAMQRRKFRRLLARVRASSPYYAALMRERDLSVEDARPEDFPVLTKTALMEHFDEIVTAPDLDYAGINGFLSASRNPRDLMKGRYVIVHTSGTSGTLGFCAYGKEEWLYGWVMLSRAMGGGFPARVAYVAAVEGHFAGVSLTVGSTWLPPFWTPLRALITARLFDINAPWKSTLDQLNTWQPGVLVSYGSALRELAFAQRKGLLHLAPRRILCGGDAFSGEDRAMVGEAFGAPVYNLYAATETMCIGLGDPADDTMVLFEDDLVVEIEEDHILVTNLFNFTTPLIRYRIDDTLIPAGEAGTPSRSYPGFRRIRGIVGRKEEKLVLENERGGEDFIHPIVIAEFFVEGLEGFRLLRQSPTRFVFQAKLGGGASDPAKERIVRKIRVRWEEILEQKKMGTVRFDIEVVPSLDSDPKTGKFRLVTYEG